MENTPSPSLADHLIIVTANLFNLAMVAVFYSRTTGIQHSLGVAYLWALMIILLAAGAIINIKARRAWWSSALPLFFAIFLVVELVLDYILQLEFRNTGLLAPYLILYYLAILGMIGYGFLTSKRSGAVTLVSYFLSQIAAIYSYTQVGHG